MYNNNNHNHTIHIIDTNRSTVLKNIGIYIKQKWRTGLIWSSVVRRKLRSKLEKAWKVVAALKVKLYPNWKTTTKTHTQKSNTKIRHLLRAHKTFKTFACLHNNNFKIRVANTHIEIRKDTLLNSLKHILTVFNRSIQEQPYIRTEKNRDKSSA